MFYGIDIIKKNKPFSFYILCQGISAIGDSFQFIAITALLMKIRGSGIFAGFSIIFTTAISTIFLPIAAIIGDKVPEKYFLVAIDILRGMVVLLFLSQYNSSSIFVLLILLSILDSLYNPPKRKMISRLLKNNGLIEGNSLLVGITGFSFVIGPILAGIMINSYGLNSAFIVNSLSFFISAVILIYIKLPNIKYEWKSKAKESLSEGIKYFTSSPKIIELVIMGTVIIFCTAIANMTFFRFAFDILQVSSREWGFMMSLFYGTNLLTMLIAQFIGKKVNKNIAPSFFLSLIAVTITWLLYGITSNLYTVMLLQVIEGTALCFFGIVLISCLQYNIKSSYMARIIGISDIVNNFGKIFGAGLAFMLLNYYNYKLIFIANSIILFIFVFYKMMFPKRLTK